MAEWFKAHAWKVCVPSQVPWVRIPLSPPYFELKLKIKSIISKTKKNLLKTLNKLVKSTFI